MPNIREDEKLANYLVWATGGSMVPPDEMNDYFRKGVELLLEF